MTATTVGMGYGRVNICDRKPSWSVSSFLDLLQRRYSSTPSELESGPTRQSRCTASVSFLFEASQIGSSMWTRIFLLAAFVVFFSYFKQMLRHYLHLSQDSLLERRWQIIIRDSPLTNYRETAAGSWSGTRDGCTSYYGTNNCFTRSHFDILVTDQREIFCYINVSSESLSKIRSSGAGGGGQGVGLEWRGHCYYVMNVLVPPAPCITYSKYRTQPFLCCWRVCSVPSFFMPHLSCDLASVCSVSEVILRRCSTCRGDM